MSANSMDKLLYASHVWSETLPTAASNALITYIVYYITDGSKSSFQSEDFLPSIGLRIVSDGERVKSRGNNEQICVLGEKVYYYFPL